MITQWKHARDASQMPLSAFERIQLKRLCEVARRLDARLAIPASSSNFSMRSAENQVLVTRSGVHKRLITPSSFLRVDLSGVAVEAHAPKPSDETALHCAVYRSIPEAKFVIHCHPVDVEFMKAPKHIFDGHELLKALGCPDHMTPVQLPVFANSQDMAALSHLVVKHKKDVLHSKAFVLQQHGIYCWGKTLEAALCHLEAILHLSQNH